MQIFYGGRQNGKTMMLIKKSAETGMYILAPNRKRADIIVKQAHDMGLKIPNPVTIQDYLRGNKFKGSSIRRDGLLISDVDDVIKTIFSDVPIKGVSFTLDKNIDDIWTTTPLWNKEQYAERFLGKWEDKTND